MSAKEFQEGPSWKWLAITLITIVGFFAANFYQARVSDDQETLKRLDRLEMQLQEKFMGHEYRIQRLEELLD